MQNEVDTHAKIIWDYMHLHHELRPVDAVFGLGSYGTEIAERSVDLFLQGYGTYLIFAGNSDTVHHGSVYHEKPEAEIYADIARERGVPEGKLIVENKSTNTGENIRFVKELLELRELRINSFLLVHKPYTERRTYATFRKQWPEKECIITSPQVTFEAYKVAREKDGVDFISVMVGDLQRIKEYPSLNFQIPQDIPDNVWEAYEQLVKLGFTKRFIKDSWLPKSVSP